MSSFSFTRDLFLVYGASLRNVGNANKCLVNDTVSHRLFLARRQNRQIIAERGCTTFNTHWSIAHKHSSGENRCSPRAFTGQISSNNRTRNPGIGEQNQAVWAGVKSPQASHTGRIGTRPTSKSGVRWFCPTARRRNEKLAFRELALSKSEFFRAPHRGPTPSRPPYLQAVSIILSKLLFSFTSRKDKKFLPSTVKIAG